MLPLYGGLKNVHRAQLSHQRKEVGNRQRHVSTFVLGRTYTRHSWSAEIVICYSYQTVRTGIYAHHYRGQLQNSESVTRRPPKYLILQES